MTDVDICLVHPYSLKQERKPPAELEVYPPLGLLSLAASLGARGFRVGLLDGTFLEPEELRDQIRASTSRAVGVTANLITRSQALRCVTAAQESGSAVIAGGPDPTLFPELYLKAGAHAVVLGEGEETLAEWLGELGRTGELPTELPGLQTSEREPAPRPLILRIDELPPPDFRQVDMEAYLRFGREHHGHSILPILSARGCPYDCSWCSRPIFGKRFRPRSPEAFVDEMEQLARLYKPDRIRVLDDVFTLQLDRIEAIAREIERRDLRLPFECLSRSDCLSSEMVELLRRAGCYRIWCGMESGSQRVLDAMSKGIQVEQSRRAARLVHQAGIELAVFVMVGYPGETPEDVQATLELLEEIRPHELSVSIAYPLPGTPFHDLVRDRIHSPPEWEHTSHYPYVYTREYPRMYYRMARRLLLAHWRRLLDGQNRKPRRWWRELEAAGTRVGFRLVAWGARSR